MLQIPGVFSQDMISSAQGSDMDGIGSTSNHIGYKAPGSINYDPVILEAVKQALVDRGLYDPQAKAVYGFALQDVLGQFQREQGLPITRQIDNETITALGLNITTSEIYLESERIADPSEIGEPSPRLPVNYSTSGSFNASELTNNIAWERIIEVEGANETRLYFQQLELGPGHSLVIRDAEGNELVRYLEPGQNDFWTEYLSPLPLTVQIEAPQGDSVSNVTISRVQARFSSDVEEESDRATEPIAPEAIIGTDDSVSIGDFDTGSEVYQIGAAVAVLVDSGDNEFCSGFLIGPNRLMTNDHCIATQADCDDATARFNYQRDRDGNLLTTTDYDCRMLLRHDFTLDYSVIELDGLPGYDWGYVDLTWDNAYNREALTIIGHPAGQPKRVSQIECSVSEEVSDSPRDTSDIGLASDMSHVCDTQPGSSGSAVFDLRHFEVIALHHWGLGSDSDNEAVRMRRILAQCEVCAQPFAIPGKPFDIDNNGREDAYIRSPNWAGIVQGLPTGFANSWIQGGRIGEWLLGTDNWDYTADVNGDGYGDVIIRSPEWLGIFKGGPSGALTFERLVFDWVGGWNLGFDDISLVGDFNGDSMDDLAIRSDEWIGLLLSNGNELMFEWIQHDWLGGWNLGRPDRSWVGDFTGDGRDDIFVRSPEWAGLFRSNGNHFEEIWMTTDWLGPWNMADTDEHLVGDFTGDGRDDVLTRNDEWVSLWVSNGAGFDVSWIDNDWVGGWNLGWIDEQAVGDFNADGRTDVFMRSPEWAALLISDGNSLNFASIQYDWIGGWNLGHADKHRIGDYNGDGMDDVMVRSPEWIGRFISNGTSLEQDFIQHDWLGGWNLGEVDRLIGGR